LYDLVDVNLMLTSFSAGELGDLIFNSVVCEFLLEDGTRYGASITSITSTG
jgi:hypothetical protein